jgi:hypothetical protein
LFSEAWKGKFSEKNIKDKNIRDYKHDWIWKEECCYLVVLVD